jgi:hypothetical protein
MSGINLNNSEEYIKNLTIFNDGKAGIVEPVRMRIEKKASSDTDDKKPVYKLIAADDKGEINEGFYYHKDAEEKGFKNYQAQRLILLAKGVFGDDVKFPVWNNPTEVLDGVMKMVAPALANKPWRVAITYGTTRRKESYLQFKSFGSFIEAATNSCSLALDKSDNTERAPLKEATPAATLIADVTKGGNPTNLDWMQS